MRLTGLTSFLFIALIGCGPSGYAIGDRPFLAKAMEGRDGDQTTFSFSHMLGLRMSEMAIKPRFDRTKDRCLHDSALHCRLLSATYGSWKDADGEPYSSGDLSVALPHDKIAAFEASLLQPIAGEAAGDVRIDSRSAMAQNVSAEVDDVAKKLAQLTDYRARLEALSKRPGIGIDGMIKLESELSNVEGQLASLQAQKADLDRRIGEERLSISLGGSRGGSIFAPAARVWRNGLRLLGESTGNALQFAIELIPWLPLILGAVFLVPWLWRVVRRRTAGASSGQTRSGMGE